MDASPKILIGIHIESPQQNLAGTLLSLYENTPQAFELLLLPDPGDETTAAALHPLLDEFPGLPRLTGPVCSGAASCFNRLIAHSADIFVFFECGVRPAPGWLDLLLAALDAQPSHGLAGPSTNRGWNEQAVLADVGSSPEALSRQADELAARYGAEWTRLDPLHSLADFCYVVKNEVVAAVGGADEAYGGGPCWEMDYNIRAARAGFGGVWAKAAWVWREPVTPQRVATEARLFEANRRYYQDRFCGQRAQGQSNLPYHPHCVGDDCVHFALLEHMQIHLPLPATAPVHSSVARQHPWVSCIMPTRGRPRFVAQAIHYFRRQHWPQRELVIVYEQDSDLPAEIRDPDIRCLRVPAGSSIGAKRNEAVHAARGEFIAQWDDDDWHSEHRLDCQLAPLLYGLADVTGLTDVPFMSIAEGVFWRASRPLFRRMFVENVMGGTLVFRRSLWLRHGPYPETSLREDADLLLKFLRGGARLARVAGSQLYAYVRHGKNTWKFQEGHALQPSEWQEIPPPLGIRDELGFYLTRPAPDASPLVSCIMPTADRRPFVAQAIRDFLRQDYPCRELVVIDDGQDSVADLIPERENIRYLRLDRKSSIGVKRNIACELACGEIIAHWDDDDWRAPSWLSSQVSTLTEAEADICGLDKVYFYRPDRPEAWQYVWDGHGPWVCGGTLCYRRDYWRRSPFADTSFGEDNAFVWGADPKRVVVNPQQHLYVARIHAGNTSPKLTANRRWRSCPTAWVEQLLLTVSA